MSDTQQIKPDQVEGGSGSTATAESGTHIDGTTGAVRLGGELLENTVVEGEVDLTIGSFDKPMTHLTLQADDLRTISPFTRIGNTNNTNIDFDNDGVHVDADVAISGQFRFNRGSIATGKVLTSNATGFGSWEEPTGVPVIDFVAAETIPAFEVVTADGHRADSSNLLHRLKVIGISTTALNSGFAGEAISCGEIINPSWAWVIGDRVYVNGTSLSTVPPTSVWSQEIGIAVRADTLMVNLKQSILL